MGPQASKSYPGQRLVKPAGPKAERASTTAEHQWLRSAVAIGSVALTLAAKDRSH
jgi:hypothetical protein